MRIKKLGIPLAIVGCVAALGASDAKAVALSITYLGSFAQQIRVTVTNNAGDSSEGIWDGFASPQFVRANFIAGAVQATTALVDLSGSVVNGCLASDTTINGTSVTTNCPNITGAVGVQVRAN